MASLSLHERSGTHAGVVVGGSVVVSVVVVVVAEVVVVENRHTLFTQLNPGEQSNV
jgi:predicted DNA-binding protein with PD1-like motif